MEVKRLRGQVIKFLNPGEMLSIERLCYCPHNSISHVGLQAKVKLGVFGHVASWFRSWNEQWTSSIIVMHSPKKAYKTLPME